MSDTSVICSNLSFAWPDDTPVFEDLSFTLGSGRTGLVAPNGSGKSTLLKLIMRRTAARHRVRVRGRHARPSPADPPPDR